MFLFDGCLRDLRASAVGAFFRGSFLLGGCRYEVLRYVSTRLFVLDDYSLWSLCQLLRFGSTLLFALDDYSL